MNHHHHHQILMPDIWRTWQQWVQINYLNCSQSSVMPSAHLNDSPSGDNASPLYHLSSAVLVTLCFCFLKFLHLCLEFGQLSFSLYVQTIGVFVERLCSRVACLDI